MKKFILCFFMLLATRGFLWAEDVNFEATVSSPQVSMDEVLQLTLTFTGVNDNLDPVSLPVIDGFTAKYLGPSSSTSVVMVNGNSESHSERSFIYNLFPNKVGKFQIPAISATIAGHTYTTQPIDVEVTQSNSQAQASSGGPSGQDQAPSTGSLKDKILLMASVDKKEVYLNERVGLTIKLLYAVPIRDIQMPQFDKTGILVDDFDKPLQDSRVVDGIRYDMVEFKTNIYPDHLGDLTLGPVQLQGNVLYKAGGGNPFNQDNNSFGADVFANFFDSYVSRPVNLSSQTILLHVLPLPGEGRPNDFSGAIGQFDFQSSVSPLQVKAGDPLTLKMDVTGSGNFKNFQMPVFQDPDFKSYAPAIKNVGDEKTAEQVIIPTSVGIKDVPAIHFTYFDPFLKSYQTITRGPFAIQVTAPNPDQEFKAVGFSNLNPAPSTMLTHQFSFGKMFSKACQFFKKLSRSILFRISLGFILIAGLSLLLWRRFQERLENDPAFARRFKAVREARHALIPADKYISTGKSKDLYALLSKALRDYLANKWHQPPAALSIGEILSRLKTAKVDEKQIAQVKTLLEQSDLVCFAGASFDPDKMRSDLSQTRDLIAHLEKSLK